MSILANNDQRVSELHNWLQQVLPQTAFTLHPLAGDASFRRYFRVKTTDHSFIAMDAPPAKEDCYPFVAIANTFQDSSVRLPTIYSSNLDRGFLLLSDFGDQQMLPALHAESVDKLYYAAMDVLLEFQQCNHIVNYPISAFDETHFWREFEIFVNWYLEMHMQKIISRADKTALQNCYQLLIDSANDQPAVLVHRDYHSRNIMLCADNKMGVLDFQDALWGPMTYDLVSLLRDCYIEWPDEKIQTWATYFYETWLKGRPAYAFELSTFMQWFDWMGLQRHLKCLGIFSRLHYRDHKQNYLKEIPRVLNYVMTICHKYPQLSVLEKYLTS